VGAYAWLVIWAELLGSVGWFSRWPLAIGTALAGLIAHAYGSPGPRVDSRRRLPPVTPITVIAALTLALIGAELLTAIGVTAHTGIVAVDALRYHLPLAAHFATTHTTTSLLEVDAGNGQTFYHLNDELLHGIGMSLVGRDSLSPLLSALSVTLCLLAAYCFGRVVDRGALAICSVAPLVGYLGSFSASAVNDWAALWPFLAAAAFVFRASREDGRIPTGVFAVSGLALGLAAGTKLNLLAPVVLLAIAAIWRGRPSLRGVGALVGGAVLTSIYWPARNLALVGSPVPSLRLPGLPHVPLSLVNRDGFSVAHYLTNRHVMTGWLEPGLRLVWSRAWPLMLVLVVAGIVAAAVRGDRLQRLYSGVCVLGLGAYLVTPTTAFGPPGHPVLFAENIRYAWPALALALLLLATAPVVRRLSVPLALVFLAYLAELLRRPLAWGPLTPTRTAALGTALALVLIRLAFVGFVRRHVHAVVASLVIVASLAAYPAQRYYLDNRYRHGTTADLQLFAWAQRLHHTRIGVVQQPSYGLEGPTWDNTVVYVGQRLPHHAFEDYKSCNAFRRAVTAHRVAYVVASRPAGVRRSDAIAWLQGAPGAQLVFSSAAAASFRVTPQLGSESC
jgi:hypothetical protein